jgi:hypothetical protein
MGTSRYRISLNHHGLVVGSFLAIAGILSRFEFVVKHL